MYCVYKNVINNHKLDNIDAMSLLIKTKIIDYQLFKKFVYWLYD